MISHIVESCPLTRFDGDLLWLHSADDCAGCRSKSIREMSEMKIFKKTDLRCYFPVNAGL